MQDISHYCSSSSTINDGRSRTRLLAHDEQTSPPPSTNDSLLDYDQKVSADLGTACSPLLSLAVSEPPPVSFLMGSAALASPSPPPADDLPELNLSSSPAAMFLSAFSPIVSERTLAQDDEGAVVAGYTLGPVVGHGGFSIIRTASSPQGGTVAVKIVRHSDLDKQPDAAVARKSLAREAQAWASLNHEHILPLFTVNHTPYADFFCTVYCPAGSLFDILKRDGHPALPQDDAGMMFRQVVRGLRYMHEVAGYVHGDLKLENVLVDEMGVCKIGDFGMARKIGETDDDLESDEEDVGLERERTKKPDGLHRYRTVSHDNTHPFRSLGRHKGKLPHHLSLLRRQGMPARHRTSSPYPDTTATVANRGFAPGSLPYAAPELLLSPSNTAPFVANPAQDIWALGVMLYALLTGKLPFSDSFEPRLQMKILHGVFDMPQGVGRSAEQALRGCMERSVPNRWTVAMVDEVAWGIGWGSTVDDVTPPPEPTRSRDVSCSRSRSGANPRNEDAFDERDNHRPTRSSSRSPSSRSTCRPPHPSDYADYGHTYHHPLLHTDTHSAHPMPTEPSLTSLSNAILRTSSNTTSDSSVIHDTAIILQPVLSRESAVGCERGRAPRNRLQVDASESLSRSRSPHEMPATPRDLPLDVVLRRRKSPPCRPSLSPPDFERTVPELETLDEDARWVLSPGVDMETDSVAGRSLSPYQYAESAGSRSPSARGRSHGELRKAVRNESMPPALSPTRSSAWMAASRDQSRYVSASGSATAAAGLATPISIPGAKQSTRSKSLGSDGRPREGWHRPLVSSVRHPT